MKTSRMAAVERLWRRVSVGSDTWCARILGVALYVKGKDRGGCGDISDGVGMLSGGRGS